MQEHGRLWSRVFGGYLLLSHSTAWAINRSTGASRRLYLTELDENDSFDNDFKSC